MTKNIPEGLIGIKCHLCGKQAHLTLIPACVFLCNSCFEEHKRYFGYD